MSQGKRWAIYVRVSTPDQEKGLDSQMRAMIDFVERQGVKNYEIFSDHGISVAKVSRPSLDRMMKEVEEGTISHVAVYSFSRFARSTTHLLKALENFQKLGVEFISFTEQIQTNSPMGRAFFTVIAAIAQLERELIVERVRNGLKAARARGVHIGREKKRDSELIRKLLKAGLTYRNVAAIAKCSHGSVWAEKQSMMRDVAEQKRKKIEQQKIIDDAIKAGPYFNKANPQLTGADSIVEREVAELNILETKALPASPDSEVGDFPSEEAA